MAAESWLRRGCRFPGRGLEGTVNEVRAPAGHERDGRSGCRRPGWQMCQTQVAEQVGCLDGSEPCRLPVLFLLLFLLPALLDGEAHLARMLAIEGPGEGAGQRIFLGVLDDHAHPGDGLKRHPVSAQHGQNRQQTGGSPRRLEKLAFDRALVHLGSGVVTSEIVFSKDTSTAIARYAIGAAPLLA